FRSAAEMVGIDSSAAADAYNQVVQAWNDGTRAVNAELLKGLAEISAVEQRNSEAIRRAAERAAAGDLDAAAELELEDYGMPDTGPLLQTKATAIAQLDAAVDQFISLC